MSVTNNEIRKIFIYNDLNDKRGVHIPDRHLSDAHINQIGYIPESTRLVVLCDLFPGQDLTYTLAAELSITDKFGNKEYLIDQESYLLSYPH